MKKLAFCLLPMLVIGCSNQTPERSDSDVNLVEKRTAVLNSNAQKMELPKLVAIDHSLLAKEVGEELLASTVTLFSDNELNTKLVQQNIEVGLDLPFRVLSLAGNGSVQTVYTSAEFLQKRHGINDTRLLGRFDKEVQGLLTDIEGAKPIGTSGLTQGYGITRLVSKYDFDTTVSRIESAVLEQEGTEWFLTLDYSQDAKELGETLPQASLLVFGAPGPGAKAMREHPTLGLDTFGQKILVYQSGHEVKVIYNDIVEMARLHYQGSSISHRVVNRMLGKTISNAVDE